MVREKGQTSVNNVPLFKYIDLNITDQSNKVLNLTDQLNQTHVLIGQRENRRCTGKFTRRIKSGTSQNMFLTYCFSFSYVIGLSVIIAMSLYFSCPRVGTRLTRW